jgi:hypothetical protein
MDPRVQEQDAAGNIKRITEPAAWPASPTLKIKGIEWTDPSGYTRSGGELTFNPPIYPSIEVEVYDGTETLVWKWSALQGDIVGS